MPEIEGVACAVLRDPSAAEVARCAEIHTAAFAGAARPWSADEIAGMATSPSGALISAAVSEEIVGFALLQMVAGEAEILTICRDPARQGTGVGAALLERAIGLCARNGVNILLLEVAETNNPAVSLYRQHGFVSVSRRPSYYLSLNGTRETALVMRKDIIVIS